MSLRIRYQYESGKALGFSIERLSDGFFYDFGDSSFKASAWSKRIDGLPEGTGELQGRYAKSLTSTAQSQFTNGSYVVAIHNTTDSNRIVGLLQATLFNGDDSPTFQAGGSSMDPWNVDLSAGAYTGTRAGAILLRNLDAAVSSRSTFNPASTQVTVGGYAGGKDPATLVLGAPAENYNTSGTIGASIGSIAHSGTDPWSVLLPGSYPAGSAGFLLGTNLDAKVSSRSTYAGGAVASVTAPVTIGTNNDKSGYTLAPSGLDAITVESGVNARQALSPILAAAAGALSGAGTGTIIVKGGNVATTRITASTDASGNRTSVTLSLPS